VNVNIKGGARGLFEGSFRGWLGKTTKIVLYDSHFWPDNLTVDHRNATQDSQEFRVTVDSSRVSKFSLFF
jgi:hypothetical protein